MVLIINHIYSYLSSIENKELRSMDLLAHGLKLLLAFLRDPYLDP